MIDRHMDLHVERRLIILGDFNHFKAEWLSVDLNLTDMVTKPTRGTKILDHILITFHSTVFIAVCSKRGDLSNSTFGLVDLVCGERGAESNSTFRLVVRACSTFQLVDLVCGERGD